MFSPKMVPQRLNDSGLVPGAIGSNTLHLFRIGEGDFKGVLTNKLIIVPDHDDHGTVQPIEVMGYDEYKEAIYNTRDQWVSGERDDDR